MIDNLYCVNLFSKKPKELITFYHMKLEIPIISTLDDDTNGVNLGFSPDTTMLCIWDANKIESPVNGTSSFVFMCENLDKTCEKLSKKRHDIPSTSKI